MATITFQFNKGAFQNVDQTELSDPSYGVLQRNLLTTDAGGLIKRPLFYTIAEAGSYPIVGMTFFKENIVVVMENRRIIAYSSAGVETDITGSSTLEGDDRPTFDSDGDYLAIAGGGQIKVWSGTGNTSDMAGSPPDSADIIQSDGYWLALVRADGEVQFAGPTATSRLTWNANDFFQAERDPDDGQALTKLGREVYVWGTNTIEIFQNVGDSTTPFRPVYLVEKSGTRSPRSIVQADSSFFYLNTNRQFMQLQGRQPVLISSPYDRVIKALETVTDCYGYEIEIGGYYLIVWQFPTEDLCVVYDYKNKQWSEWTGEYINQQDEPCPFGAAVKADTWTKTNIVGLNNGRVCYAAFSVAASSTFTAISDQSEPSPSSQIGTAGSVIDEPSATPQQIRFRHRSGIIDHGTSALKRNKRYTLTVKRGTGSYSFNPQVMIRFKDDDKGWSDWTNFELGLTGDFESSFDLRNTGVYQRRQIEIMMTDSAELILTKFEEEFDVRVR